MKGLPITHCKDCPFKKETNQWSSDGWDQMEDWVCEKAGGRKIQGAVEWHEVSKIPVPDWCPLPDIGKEKSYHEVPPLKDQEGNILEDWRGNKMGR